MVLVACAPIGPALILPTVNPSSAPSETVQASSTSAPTMPGLDVEPTPSPTSTLSIPAPTPTATDTPVYTTALVWESDLQVPVILYHRFLPLGPHESSRTKMSLEDFQQQLDALYSAGYSLISMEKWLAGDISLPVGRRPLILSMDDLFFADQIFLEADGTPSMRSGLGLLWHFSQTHPDFGFSAALFFNLGDKYYANKKTSTWFNVAEGWQDALAQVIVWCIEHDAMPYNHTYQHSFLNELDALAIKDEFRRNDLELRRFLKRAKREDLIPRLKNYIGLPYGVWPETAGLTKYMLAYRNPENLPVEAVFEAGYYYEERFLPAPFMPNFERMRVPRITTNTRRSIEFLVENRRLFPETGQYRLGPVKNAFSDDPEHFSKLIQKAVNSGGCPEGTYRVGRYFFDVRDGEQILLWTVAKPED